MPPFAWVGEAIVEAIHDAQLTEHGGLAGLRDRGMLESALAKPLNLSLYGKPDLAACAAAYGCGIARNHPFVDGNKRTAFVVTALCVAINGCRLSADNAESVVVMLAVAAGTMGEDDFAVWLREHIVPA